MSAVDGLEPPDFAYLGGEDQENIAISARRLYTQDYHAQLLKLEERNRKRLKQARREQERIEQEAAMSSDSEADDSSNKANDKNVKLTPANSTPEELVKVDPSEIGMTAAYKYLYSGKEDKHGRYQWQTKIPEDLGVPAEDAESERLAVIVRKVKAYNNPKKVLILHSIVIQSPLLKDLLKDVLDGYPGVTVGLKRLEFSGRFEPLIHRWKHLQESILQLKFDDQADKPDSAERLKHAELLCQLINDEFKETIESSDDMLTQGVITYEHLWTLFHPGSLVYTKLQNQDRVFRLHSSKYGTDHNGHPVFWLTCQYVDYDGSRFGTQKLNVCIRYYDGTKPITKLSTLPLECHSSADEVKEKLIERGSKVETLAGSHYRAYNGVGWRLDHQGRPENFTVKGRIVIDTHGWNKFNPNMAVRVRSLPVNDDSNGSGSSRGSSRRTRGDDEYDAGYDDGDGGLPVEGSFANEEEGESKRVSLNEEQKLICIPFVRGYSLKTKQWLNFVVNAIQDIAFSNEAFESLVLPKNKKELILGFTSTQQGYRSQFDDVIEGKGRGIIILLCGPPGVGKTLTAEAIAEKMKVPLYMLSAGDLGSDPRHVETKLQGVMDLCTRWNAILLIDEADVFLEERSFHELERNKLVSIFLRVLEYYEGIMFLTTNRVQTFDQAFQSRIHISLQYPDLDHKSRKAVWRNFLEQHNTTQAASREKPSKPLASAAKSTHLADTPPANADEEARELHWKRTQPHAMTDKDINKLASLDVNGRQIKNILKTAMLLASVKGEPLSYEHVELAMDSTQHLHSSSVAENRTKSSLFS